MATGVGTEATVARNSLEDTVPGIGEVHFGGEMRVLEDEDFDRS